MEPAERTKRFIDLTRVQSGKKVRLKDLDTGWAQNEELAVMGKDVVKERANQLLEENRQELSKAQELLYADHKYAVLVILQGMDAAGKDSTIKHVMSGVNPQGCNVTSFKQPSSLELDHDFLWRQIVALPTKGMIGIFNRSYYEEVLVVRVHPNLLDRQNLPTSKYTEKFWDNRYQDINALERHLVRNGTLILKFFLHASRGEQKKRFLERLCDSSKNWKFSEADMHERDFWNDYIKAYECMLSATSTKWAPWFIIPADYKWVARTLVAGIITSSIVSLGIKKPEVSKEKLAAIEAAKKKLEAE